MEGFDPPTINKPSRASDHSPPDGGVAGAPYRIQVAEYAGGGDQEGVGDLVDVGPDVVVGRKRSLQQMSPLIKELSAVTREVSMIARQGTLVSQLPAAPNTNNASFDLDRSVLSPSPSATAAAAAAINRTGLVSRISILPAAFAAPPSDIDVDAVSGACVQTLSFLFAHAPSLRCFAEEVSVESVDLIDEECESTRFETALRKEHFLFPGECFDPRPPPTPPPSTITATTTSTTTTTAAPPRKDAGSTGSGSPPVEAVRVVIVTQDYSDHQGRQSRHPAGGAGGGGARNGAASGGGASGGAASGGGSSTARRKISREMRAGDVERLPLVTPRAILLTPEPIRAYDTDDDETDGRPPETATITASASQSSLSTESVAPRRQQVMICLKPASRRRQPPHGGDPQRRRVSVGPDEERVELAEIEDVFRESSDLRGFDYYNCATSTRRETRGSRSGRVTRTSLLKRLDFDDEKEDSPATAAGVSPGGAASPAGRDAFVVMELKQWPARVAARWAERERLGWPSSELLAELATVPCHVSAFPAAAAGDDDDNNATNRHFLRQNYYTFPLIDNVLFGALSVKQRAAYAVVSALYRRHFHDPPLLRLCHVKAAFFWACERAPPDFWADTPLARCVFHVLTQLLEAVDGACLRHFITEDNLLADADAAVARETADMIRLVRKTPAESIINSHHFGPLDESLCEPVLSHVMAGEPPPPPPPGRRSASAADCVAAIVRTAVKVGRFYAGGSGPSGKEKALSVLDDACSSVFAFRHFDAESVALVRLTCDLYSDLCELDKVIEYVENMAYMAYEYECDHLDLSLCLCRLACLYHCKASEQHPGTLKAAGADSEAAAGGGGGGKAAWLVRAQEYFDLALLEDYSLVTVLHYATFLIKQCRPLEAVDKLINALALTDETDEAELFADTTTFTLLEVNTLDDDLALEVTVMGEVTASSVVVGYYQLCRALVGAGISRGLEEYMTILEILAGCEENKHRHNTWALLGYVRRATHDLHGARQAFEAALALDPNYFILQDQVEVPMKRSGCARFTCCSIL